MKLETFRNVQLAIAEWINAWRIIPRIMVIGYMWLIWHLIEWYTSLEHYMIKDCLSGTVSDCIGKAPSVEHAALITAIVGAAAAIFAFYTRSGNKSIVHDELERKKRSKGLRDTAESQESPVFHNRPDQFPNRSKIEYDDDNY